MDLTPQDVRDIVRVLDSAGLDEFSLDTGEFAIEVRRAGAAGWTAEQHHRRAPNLVGASGDTPPEPVADPGLAAGRLAPGTPALLAGAATAADAGGESADTRADGLVVVRPPLLGTFYRAPQPGAAPFVAEGDRVEPDTVVGIVETMKMMTPVLAGARGVVREIRAGDGEFVESDTVLLLVDPAP